MNRELVLCANYEGLLPDTSVFTISRKIRTQHLDKTSLVDCSQVEPSVTKFSFVLNPIQASCFNSELHRSERYAKHVFRNFRKMCTGKPDVIALHILLTPVVAYTIDHKFGKEIQVLVNESIELDHAMSGLSTLGGAFSSLGDQFIDFAKVAGKISVQQYKMAMKLGDPLVIMRCQLYFSISLIQCSKLKSAKHVIYNVYTIMKSYPKDRQDQRIVYMCLGIWAKLKYVWQMKKNSNNQVFQT